MTGCGISFSMFIYRIHPIPYSRWVPSQCLDVVYSVGPRCLLVTFQTGDTNSGGAEWAFGGGVGGETARFTMSWDLALIQLNYNNWLVSFFFEVKVYYKKSHKTNHGNTPHSCCTTNVYFHSLVLSSPGLNILCLKWGPVNEQASWRLHFGAGVYRVDVPSEPKIQSDYRPIGFCPTVSDALGWEDPALRLVAERLAEERTLKGMGVTSIRNSLSFSGQIGKSIC